MKIRIITIHGIPNFGSVFQSYALCQYLINQGYADIQLIDYNPSYNKPHSFRSLVGKLLNYKSYLIRAKKFRKFVENNLHLTDKSFNTLADLSKHPFEADVYIAGGDQLWNVYHNCGQDDAYKLTFAQGKKISYATSMGQTDFSNEQLEKLSAKLNSFSHISVRESSSVRLLADVGVNALQCVDPVFLLPADSYERFLHPNTQPKYMLVYLVTPSDLLERCISYLSKKHNLEVILCSGFSRKCTCDKFLKDLGPDEILSYIKNAEIVLSASFHATAFSVIFKKQFFTLLPDAHTNERITDFLETRGLDNRLITNDTNIFEMLDKEIDYDALKAYDEMIIQSKKYLQEALTNDK